MIWFSILYAWTEVILESTANFLCKKLAGSWTTDPEMKLRTGNSKTESIFFNKGCCPHIYPIFIIILGSLEVCKGIRN